MTARSIVVCCQKPGTFLRKGLVKYAGGKGEVTYFLEPEGRKVLKKRSKAAG
jgi:hypothetical protein